MAAKNTQKKKKRFRKRAGPFCWLLALLVTGAGAYFLYNLIAIDILPTIMLAGVCLITVVVTFLVLRHLLFKTKRPITRTLFFLLSLSIGVVYGIGAMFIQDTSDMFNAVTNLTDKTVNVVTTYGMINFDMETVSDLNGQIVGTVSSLNEEGTQGAIEQLESQGAQFTVREYDSVYELVDALYDAKVMAILLPEEYHDALNEAATDENQYSALTTFTNTIDQYVYYTDRLEITKNPSDPVSNIMTTPFTILVSGNDSYGTLASSSRSDVNMLVTINPKTAEVLIVSLPRDTYLPVTCKKNTTACASVSGLEDKLTHTGIYGVGSTESSIEDFMDIEINYTVRVNFSSLINLVDAIGGIDVEVEEGLEVETFYSNGMEGVHAGVNHLNGERALAFSRERYAYADGDNQRVKNQQIVMKALIKAMISPSMVVNYPKVMEALSTAFETNMSAKEIKSMLTLELTRFPDWNIQSYALSNESSYQYSPANGDISSVTLADPEEVKAAAALIQDVLDGKTPDLTTMEEYNSTVSYSYSTYSGYSYDTDDADTYQDTVQEETVSEEYDGYQQSYPYDTLTEDVMQTQQGVNEDVWDDDEDNYSFYEEPLEDWEASGR